MVLLYSKQPGNSRQIPDEANLGMTASAISQAIRKLENYYDCASPDYLRKPPSSTLYATTAHRTQSAKVRIVLDCLMRCFGEEKGLIKSAEN